MLPEILVGASVGLLVGMAGLGGPMLFLPLLVLAFGYSLTGAVPISLAVITVTQGIALLGHYARRHVNLGVAKYFIIGSVPSSIAVSQAMNLLAANPSTLERLDLSLTIAVGLLLLFFSAIYLLQALAAYRPGRGGIRLGRREKGLALGLGLLVGGVVASTSMAGGSIITLFLVIGLRMRSIKAVGTSLSIVLPMSALSTLVYLAHGAVPFSVAGMFLLGSVPAALLGTMLSDRVAGKPLRVIISLIVFAGGMMLLYNAVG